MVGTTVPRIVYVCSSGREGKKRTTPDLIDRGNCKTRYSGKTKISTKKEREARFRKEERNGERREVRERREGERKERMDGRVSE